MTPFIATAIGAGQDHKCAVLNGGSIQCWGDNSAGEFGIGISEISSAVPVTVDGF